MRSARYSYMCISRVYQCLYFQVLAIFCFYICLHIQFSFSFTILAIQNYIFVLGIYMGDFLYCAYLRSSLKPCSFSFSLLSDPSWTFHFFIDCVPLQSLAMYSSLLYLKHFLVLCSFFFDWHSFTIYLYLLQLKHLDFLSLKLLLDFSMFMGCPYPLQVI